MSRYASATPTSIRDRLKLAQKSAPTLALLYPQLAELRVEFNFEDGTDRPPSQQVFSHFPPARSLFRYPCPCHSCDGDFDLTASVADLTKKSSKARLAQDITVACPGHRPQGVLARVPCPVRATISISARRCAQE